MITHRSPTFALLLGAALALCGCVDSAWKAAPQLAPAQLSAERTLAGTPLDAAAWPADGWWHGYGDPQLDALVAEAIAGSPSLTAAAARLRSAQGQALAVGALKLPNVALDAHLAEAPGGFAKGMVLTQATLTLPQGDIAGDASVMFAQPPSISGNVTSKRIDLDALLEMKSVNPPAPKARANRMSRNSPVIRDSMVMLEMAARGLSKFMGADYSRARYR